MFVACLFVLTANQSVRGHGSLVNPAPRNSVDRSLPPWSHGKFASAGTIEPFGCNCVNGTSADGTECDSALSCFWFSQGCTIGCPACSGNGSRAPNLDWCPHIKNHQQATNNDPRTRTLNRNATAGSEEDVYKFNPWRAPGSAPNTDPCGMAGGTTVAQNKGGEYPTTRYAKQGDLGSKTLKPLPTGVVWHVGGVAEISWYIRANHGGGYQFRIAPADSDLTEKTFQQTPLPFAGNGIQKLRFKGGREESFNATYLNTGTLPVGSTWAMNPIPMCCPDNAPCTITNVHTCSNDAHSTVPVFPFPTKSGNGAVRDFSIVDTVRIPEGVSPGKYVLQWRWDAEQTSQVWGACSDVTIVP